MPKMPLRLATTPKALIAFVALMMLCGLLHEFVHHLVGAMLCGGFGHKTFNSFVLLKPCARPAAGFVLSTWAGPLATFALMWLGWHRMERGKDLTTRTLGLALLFGNFPINRMMFALMHVNDEQYVTSHVFGDNPIAFWLTALAVWVMTLPPMLAAWRAMRGRGRWWRFTAWFVLPFAFVIVFFGFVLEEWLLLKLHVLAREVYGIPLLLIVAEIVALIVYAAWKNHLVPAPAVATAHARADENRDNGGFLQPSGACHGRFENPLHPDRRSALPGYSVLSADRAGVCQTGRHRGRNP